MITRDSFKEGTVWDFYYPSLNIRQQKIVIRLRSYDAYMAMPYNSKKEQSEAKRWLKKYTKGYEFFCQDSPYAFAAITGVYRCNGEVTDCIVTQVQNP